jgi:hypothetical protein
MECKKLQNYLNEIFYIEQIDIKQFLSSSLHCQLYHEIA